ncbi:MAG: hypothetical protein AAF414_02785 [Pseudomonadota bacterium]
MARFKLAPNTELSDVGRAIYALAEDARDGGQNQGPLENDVRAKFDNPPTIEFLYDKPSVLHIVVPDLSTFESAPPGSSGLDKFGNEALGFVVVFGCGP